MPSLFGPLLMALGIAIFFLTSAITIAVIIFVIGAVITFFSPSPPITGPPHRY